MSNSVFGDDSFEQSYVSANFLGALFGSVASVITIVIIERMPKTGHLLLLLYMSYLQLGYDLFSFTLNVDINYYLKVISFAIDLPCGIAGTIVSNWMVFIAWYVVTYQKPFDVFGKQRLILVTSILPSMISPIVYVIGESYSNQELIDIAIIDINNNIRMISIGLNFILILVIIYKITTLTSTTRTLTKQSISDLAIRTLALRMIFYPIAQAISRASYSWYEFEFGSYRTVDDHMSDEKMSCLMLIAILTPTAPIVFLVILCIMQPKAYFHFKAIICGVSYDELIEEYTKSRGSNSTPQTQKNLARLSGAEFTDSVEKNLHTRSYSQDSSGIQISVIRWFTRPSKSVQSPTVLTEAVTNDDRQSVSPSVKGSQRDNDSNNPRNTTGRLSVRPSERFTDEILRMTEGDENITPEVWQEIFRFSTLQTDEDLYGFLEHAPQDFDRGSGYGVETRESDSMPNTDMLTIRNQLHQPGDYLR